MELIEILWKPALLAIISALTSTAVKHILEKNSFKQSKDKLENLDRFKSLLVGIADKHPAVIEEEVYHYTKTRYLYSEIMFVLKLKNPMHCLKLLSKCKRYVEFNEEQASFSPIEKISNSVKADKEKKWLSLHYYLFATPPFFSVLYAPFLIRYLGPYALGVILVLVTIVLPVSFMMLNEIKNIDDATKLIKQTNYTHIAKT